MAEHAGGVLPAWLAGAAGVVGLVGALADVTAGSALQAAAFAGCALDGRAGIAKVPRFAGDVATLTTLPPHLLAVSS